MADGSNPERSGSGGDPENGPRDVESILTRRGFLSASLMAGGALLGGAGLSGCHPPVAGGRNSPAAEGKQLGTLAFVDEGAARADTPFGAELDGRLFTDLSSLTPEKAAIPTERFYIRTRASRLLDLRHPWSIRVGTRSHLEAIPVRDL